ncbi:MAG: hypothetical protein R3B83_03925 [Nitrospirales bacterium]|nr:hypothetical protein [Nitrospirales bacterium]
MYLGLSGMWGRRLPWRRSPSFKNTRHFFFAPFTGAGILRKAPPDPTVINYRASYEEETAAMIDALITIGNIQPEQIAFSLSETVMEMRDIPVD